MKRNMPVTVKNLGSLAAQSLNFSDPSLWSRMGMRLARKAAALPVYLVNEEQMDRLYPPKLRRAFDPGRLRERFAQTKDRESDPMEVLEGLDDFWEIYKHVVAVGLYMSSSAMAQIQKKKIFEEAASTDPEEPPLPLTSGPAIFLCPERIVAWATRAKVPSNLLLAKVYYHELAHSHMDTLNGGQNPYQETWGRVVEESLANWIALKHFKGNEAILVHRLIEQQPAEYQGCIAVDDQTNWLFWDSEFFEAWREHLFWFLHRRPPIRFLEHLPLILENLSPVASYTGWSTVRAWRDSKRSNAFRDREIVLMWKKYARRLLEEAVS